MLGTTCKFIIPGSTSLDKSSETQLTSSSNDPASKVQSLEIEIEDDSFMGMPFVLLSDGNWIKNMLNLVVERSRPKRLLSVWFSEDHFLDAGDGQGTAKALLDKIANMESEAQKSFMHRVRERRVDLDRALIFRSDSSMVESRSTQAETLWQVQELKDKMQSSGMPWPGDEGQQRWEQAWTAIKKVVKGLGETLVGAYPGRALSFMCKKNDLNSPQEMQTEETSKRYTMESAPS